MWFAKAKQNKIEKYSYNYRIFTRIFRHNLLFIFIKMNGCFRKDSIIDSERIEDAIDLQQAHLRHWFTMMSFGLF